jgi:rubrerythrin
MGIHRRHFLLALGGGSGALLAACGDEQGSTDSTGGFGVEQDTQAGRARDVTLLNEAYGLEQTAVAAYTGGARLLSGEAARLAEQLRGQEEEHARFLQQAIRASGGRPVELGEGATAELPSLRTGDEFLEFAVEAEGEAIRTYTEIIPQLSQPRLRGDLAAILTNEAQHASALRLEIGTQPVPEARVTGE